MATFLDTLTVEGQATVEAFAGSTTSTATSASTLTLTAASTMVQFLTGSTAGQIVQLPDATTIASGQHYEILNTSTNIVQLNDGGGNFQFYISPGQFVKAVLQTSGTTAGVWQLQNNDIQDGSNYNAGATLFDDFIAPVNSAVLAGNIGWFIQAFGGTLGTATSPGNLDAAHPGTLNLATGAATASGVDISLGQIYIGAGPIVWEAMVRIGTLGTTAQQYIIQCGYGTGLNTTADPTSGVFFEYSNATGGNFWRCRTGKSSTYTSTTSTSAIAANTWYKLRYYINPAASSVSFYAGPQAANPTLLTTITTNIPTSIAISPFFQIRKTNGTTAMSFDIDYCSMNYQTSVMR